jgi:hypothetical protein
LHNIKNTGLQLFPRLLAAVASLVMLGQATAQTPLTPQTAEYLVSYGDIELGKARYRLPPSDNGLYTYEFDSDLTLLVLSDSRHMRSEFTAQGDQLQPLRFLHEREGTGRNFREQSAFAKEQKVVHSRYKDERSKLTYETPLFDPLMVQLQVRLDLQSGKDTLHYQLVKDNEIEDYDFRVVGKESIEIESGRYDAVKIEVVRDSKKRQTFFWMAPELAYLPVRLTHFDRGNKQLDIKLLNYHFSEVTNLAEQAGVSELEQTLAPSK